MRALVEHRDAGGQRQGLGLVVGDVDRGDADVAMQPPQLEAHLGAQHRVEVRERLVEQEQARLDDRGCGRAPPAAAGRPRAATADAPRSRRGPPARSAAATRSRERSARDPALAEPERHVLEHREVRPERVVLEDHAEVALPRRDRVDDLVVDHDAAFVGGDEAGEQAQQGGLAAARRPQQGVELAGADRERDVPHRPVVAVALAHAFHAHFRQPDQLLRAHDVSPPPGVRSRDRRSMRATSGTTARPSAASTR